MNTDLDKHVIDLEYIHDKVWFEDHFNLANVLVSIWECIGSLERIKNQSTRSFRLELRDKASIASGYLKVAGWLFDDNVLQGYSADLEKELHYAWFNAFYKIGPLRTVSVKIRRRVLDLWIEYVSSKPDFAKELDDYIRYCKNSPMYNSGVR